jgi:hypothetical protein
MESPDVYNLAKIKWQFFGTLTFKSERLPERVRLQMWFALLRRVAARFRVHFPRLPWCLRQERGEITARRHFHFLLTGLPRKTACKATCFLLMSEWEKLKGGMARVTLFDHRLDGVGYVAKCLGEQPNGGDVYESAKFGNAYCELMLSDGAQKVLRAVTMKTERR